MKKIKQLFAAAMLMFSAGAWAQTDVTSTYITNADFSSTTGWTQEHSNSYWTLGNGKIGTYAVANSKTSTTDETHLSSEYCLGIQCRWSGNYANFSQTISSLPAGAYTLTFDVQNKNNSTSATYNNLFKVTVGGNTYTDSSTEWMSGSSNWTTHTIEFTLTEAASATISLGYGTGSNNLESSKTPHLYVSHLKLEVYPFATSSDYEALSTAISTVEGITWGFDAGEYAPYNYVEVLQALAAAKAIDPNSSNSQATVQALTATLNGASWTANVEEVNAFYDGSFTDAASVTGNTCPKGWHGSNSHYTDGYWVRLMHTDGSSNTGLQHFSSNSAMMAKSTPRYGLDAGYTMPLNEETYYTLSFDFAGWGGGNSSLYTTIVITDGSNNTMTVIPSRTETQNENGQSNTDAWKTYTGIFQTGTAGNYKLLLSKTEGDGSGYQITYGDMVLKQTTVAEATTYYNTVLDEVDDYYDASANGGSEKTAFKTAIDANVSSYSVAQLMEAAANLYTLRDAFVAATPKYNALEAERASAIALGVSSEAANGVTMTSASELQDKLNALYVLEDVAVTTGYTVDATTKFGSWTPQNLGTKNDEHWSGTTVTYYDKWDANGFTGSITSTVTLPAGKYVFKLAARAQTGAINGAFNMSVKVGDNDAVYKDFVAKDNTGKGITTSGAVSYSDGEFCNNGNGRGWEWRFIGFELDDEASVTLKGYAQIYGSNWVGFSDATLLTTSDNVAILKDLLNDEITTATNIDKTTNVGEGVFQTPSSAAEALTDAITTAQDVYDNSSASSSDVSTALSDLQTAEATYKATVNAPADGKKYYIKVATTGHAKFDKAWLLAPGATSDNNPTGYTIQANNDAAAYLSQAFTFTQVSGNTYNISMTLTEGEVYLTYGSLNGSAAGWNKQQIQATTEAANKGEFKIYAGNAANTFKIFNTVDNNYIDCQDGGNIYTDTGIEKELFSVAEASQASVAVSVEAGKLATRIFPFKPTLPSGVVAYSCAANTGSSLTLVEVADPAANVPYILYSEAGCSSNDLTGWGTATADTYKVGYLTGVFTRTEVPTDSYVLQTQGGTQAFYKVNQAGAYSSPYRVYVTVPAAEEVKAFGFSLDDMETAIEAARAEGESTVTLRYNVAGQQMQNAQKGLNIIKMEDGSVRKVLVK